MQHCLIGLNFFKYLALYVSAYMAIIMCYKLSWRGKCCAHLVSFLVRSHVCVGASLGDGLFSPCVA
jgi:serine acetyltransferase